MTRKLLYLALLTTTLLSISCGRKIEDSKKNQDGGAAAQINKTVTVSEHRKETLFNLIQGSDYNLIFQELQNHSTIEYQFKNGQTPLIRAIIHNLDRAEIISLFLDKTKDINFKDSDGHNAFEHTLFERNTQPALKDNLLVKLVILGASFDIELGEYKGIDELLELFSLNKTKELIGKISKNKNETLSYENIFKIIADGETNYIEYLLRTRIDIQNMIRNQNLIIAAMEIKNQNNKIKMFRLLELNGAKLDLKTPIYPLIRAAQLNDRHIYTRLLSKGADVLFKDEKNQSAIYYVIKILNKDLVEMTLAKATKVLSEDKLKDYVTQACQDTVDINVRRDFHYSHRNSYRLNRSHILYRILKCHNFGF